MSIIGKLYRFLTLIILGGFIAVNLPSVHAAPSAILTENIVINGDFEIPPDGSHYSAGQSFPGWTVDYGDVDLVQSSFWPGVLDEQSIDLNGGSAGGISQILNTTAGENYVLKFGMAGNPDTVCPDPGTIKTMEVWWGGKLLDTLTFDVTGRTRDDLGWIYHEYSVTATDVSTQLKFYSLTPGCHGPVIDNVSVQQSQSETLNVSVDITGNFFAQDEQGSRISVDGQRYASLPIRVHVSHDGLPVSGAVVSVKTSPFEKILGLTDSAGTLDSSIDNIPPVTLSLDGGKYINVGASDTFGSGESGDVLLYSASIFHSDSHVITSAQANEMNFLLLSQHAARPGLDSGLCKFVEIFEQPQADFLCNLRDILTIATLGVVNHTWVLQGNDDVRLVEYQFNAAGQDVRYLAGVSVFRDGNPIYDDLSWWEKDQEPSNFERLADARMLTVQLASPATIYIINPEGKGAGTDPMTGNLTFGFDLAISDKGDEPYSALIPLPEDGNYKLEVIGTGTGPYTLTIGSLDAEGNSNGTVIVKGSTAPGNIAEYNVNYNQTSKSAPSVKAVGTIEFDPVVLNLKSRGSNNAFTAYLELPLGMDLRQIDLKSIKLEGTIPALSGPICIGDYDRDRIPDIVLKFNRQSLIDYLIKKKATGVVNLTMTGKYKNGIQFQASNTIFVTK
jgi:choice-of-anchor C domain-containing protein